MRAVSDSPELKACECREVKDASRLPQHHLNQLRRLLGDRNRQSRVEIIRCCASAASEIMGVTPAVNMRVGGSDARWFRMAGIPTIVYGPTLYNMGAPDEYADISELGIVSRAHALTAFDFLTKRENGK
jgi:hypothetical protein